MKKDLSLATNTWIGLKKKDFVCKHCKIYKIIITVEHQNNLLRHFIKHECRNKSRMNSVINLFTSLVIIFTPNERLCYLFLPKIINMFFKDKFSHSSLLNTSFSVLFTEWNQVISFWKCNSIWRLGWKNWINPNNFCSLLINIAFFLFTQELGRNVTSML